MKQHASVTVAAGSTATETAEFDRNALNESLFRVHNQTDDTVELTVDVTDGGDPDFSRSESYEIGGDIDSTTDSIGAGGVTTHQINEPWERMRFNITAQNGPTEDGEVLVIEMRDKT